MNITTARRAADAILTKLQDADDVAVWAKRGDVVNALAVVIRREARAYHRRALQAARARGRR